MVASVVITGRHSIGVNSNNKIRVGEHLLALNEVPFFRYRFASYGDEDLEYIKANMKKFIAPVHLIEMHLGEDTLSLFEKFEADSTFENLAKFIYVDITDEHIATGLSDETVGQLEAISEKYFDRIMIKDNSEHGLYPLAAERLKIAISNASGFDNRDIGICGSSMSFRCGDEPGQACLTAVWARRIQADYATTDDCVVPSSNHEKMTCCGCIQYVIADKDCPAPLSAKEKSAKTKEAKAETGEPKEKAAPKAKPTGFGLSRLIASQKK